MCNFRSFHRAAQENSGIYGEAMDDSLSRQPVLNVAWEVGQDMC